MSLAVHQGDILKVEGVKHPVLIVSKDTFNQTETVFGCPVYSSGEAGPLRIPISGTAIDGIAGCDQMSLLDLRYRGFSYKDKLPMEQIMNITDAVQSIFDYI